MLSKEEANRPKHWTSSARAVVTDLPCEEAAAEFRDIPSTAKRAVSNAVPYDIVIHLNDESAGPAI